MALEGPQIHTDIWRRMLSSEVRLVLRVGACYGCLENLRGRSYARLFHPAVAFKGTYTSEATGMHLRQLSCVRKGV